MAIESQVTPNSRVSWNFNTACWETFADQLEEKIAGMLETREKIYFSKSSVKFYENSVVWENTSNFSTNKAVRF